VRLELVATRFTGEKRSRGRDPLQRRAFELIRGFDLEPRGDNRFVFVYCGVERAAVDVFLKPPDRCIVLLEDKLFDKL